MINQQRAFALVGTPNSGKTTLYNWLTGSKFKTVNYPGATVEYSLGSLASRYGEPMTMMDTPGTYSLHPKSADEVVTLKSIYENPELGRPDGIIVVVDGTQLQRHLLLAQQVKETQFPMIIVVTMADLLKKQGLSIDLSILKKHFECEVLAFDGLLGGGIGEIVSHLRTLNISQAPNPPSPWNLKTQEQRNKTCEHVAELALFKNKSDQEKLNQIFDRTQRMDRILLHPIWGFFLFLLIMTLLFSSIFWASQPAMELIDQLFGWMGDQVGLLWPGSLWADFLSQGVLASFGAVFVFIPQIFILFLGIGVLESSGYLARAATLIDRPFSALGLSGRSFVPLLSGFACAVPALMATRNIPSTRDRWITNFMIPLMSCSARLPVYALLLSFLFVKKPWFAGLALATLYIGALVVGFFAAAVLNRIIPKDRGSFFMMELPLYRQPKWMVILHQSVSRTKSFIFRAGPVIFVLSVLLWFGTTFPNHQMMDKTEKIESSYAGQLGQHLEPIFKPMGVDWRVGVGLISAFAAREVFVSSMAVVFQATSENEEAQQENLLQVMSEAKNKEGRKIFTVGSVIGLIVFFMIALQCMSTVGMSYKESGSWKFAGLQLLIFNLVAYVLATGIFQTFEIMGWN